MDLRLLYVVWVGSLSLFTFLFYGMDKRKARKHQYRIPENTLLMLCAIGGAFGGFAGMHVFHHKTLHAKFRIVVPLCAIVWIVIAVIVVWHVQ